jgi:4,5-DOPA dioxygenase extradiol
MAGAGSRAAPGAWRNHPTSEHQMPLYTALGAGGASVRGTRLHHAFELGTQCLDAWRFD